MPPNGWLERLCRDVSRRYLLCTSALLGKGLPHALAQAYRYAFLPFLQLLCAAVFICRCSVFAIAACALRMLSSSF